MKHLDEYRDVDGSQRLLSLIDECATKEWTIMEICGGQTHSLVKNGIIDLLPEKIKMVHGPGCPVCVTPTSKIDQAIELAARQEVVLVSFGDMLRVPGSDSSLLSAKASGADVRIVYSPIEAVEIAKKNPDKEIVFFGVGFETTAPANALAILQAERAGIENFSMLASHVLVPPAMEAILGANDNRIQGFLAAGHVCAVMGVEAYEPIAERYQAPIVITGFEPVDLLQGILQLVTLLEAAESTVENAYSRVVKLAGNQHAQNLIDRVFEVGDKEWRGLGDIPSSGLMIRSAYRKFDAVDRFDLGNDQPVVDTPCIAGEVLRGLKKPHQCPYFGKECKPEHPMGAPMVSSEGACAAYYNYQGLNTH